MTFTAESEAAANELTPLADYLGSVLRCAGSARCPRSTST
jgi:hypothetical protein